MFPYIQSEFLKSEVKSLAARRSGLPLTITGEPHWERKFGATEEAASAKRNRNRERRQRQRERRAAKAKAAEEASKRGYAGNSGKAEPEVQRKGSERGATERAEKRQ